MKCLVGPSQRLGRGLYQCPYLLNKDEEVVKLVGVELHRRSRDYGMDVLNHCGRLAGLHQTGSDSKHRHETSWQPRKSLNSAR